MSNGNNIFDNDNSILKLLAHWTVENNITLSAFSALLKILKTHTCFNHFPVDARTVLKTNKSNEQNKIKIIHPGYYYRVGLKCRPVNCRLADCRPRMHDKRAQGFAKRLSNSYHNLFCLSVVIPLGIIYYPPNIQI